MDVEGVISRDTQPFFQVPPYVTASTASLRRQGKPLVEEIVASWIREFPERPEVICIFADLDCTTSWLAEQSKIKESTFWTQLDVDALCIIPLLHRCLELSTSIAGSEPSDTSSCVFETGDLAFQEALRCAILLFLAPIRRCFGLPSLGVWLPVLLENCD
jgi:hypothetical protein